MSIERLGELVVVAPVYNEEDGIAKFIDKSVESLDRVRVEFGIDVSLILVDDGSSDNTKSIVHSKFQDLQSGYIKGISLKYMELSRNYGHQVAVWAGLEDISVGSHAVVIDADLQDDPNLIIDICLEFTKGSDVVLMKRKTRKDTFFKKITANFFYWMLHLISDVEIVRNTGDFYGLSPRARVALISHKESVKYIRGLVQSIGFNRTVIEYDRDPRFAGKTHYSISKMIKLAISGITGFSVGPLIFVAYLAMVSLFFDFLLLIFVAYLHFSNSFVFPSGWAFMMFSILILFAIQMTGLALMSIYIARLNLEIKSRPLYFISSSSNSIPKEK
jgi:glycosyltransferase involved in cell wall biosynthesis